jgi:predicted nucleic acid-binding Zn ribbon protein
MSSRRAPRKLDAALGRLVSERSPRTLLADVQTAWPRACGETIAANAEPVSERDGQVTIACATGAWAQELEMMGDELIARLEALVGPDRLRRLRFTADLARHR